MLEKYVETQPIITKLLLNSLENNKVVQAYLFVDDDSSFLMDYSLAFSKMLICNGDRNIEKLIDNNSYPELKIINPTNNIIKKEDLINLQKDFIVKPTIGKKLVYIINEADKLNSSSANTILKFLEEPNDDVVAILLTDNLSNILPTIKSRCQVLIFNKNKIESEKNINYYYGEYSKKIKSEEFTLDYFSDLADNTVSLIKLLNKSKINTLFHYKEYIFDKFKNKEDFIIMFDLMLYFYYDILNYILKRNIIYMCMYKDEIIDMSKDFTIEKITSIIKIIEISKNKLNSNMNIKLLIDDFVINYSEV